MTTQNNLFGNYPLDLQRWCATNADPAKIGLVEEYNNNNFDALQSAIESLTNETYANYVQQHIFAPLGMQCMSTAPPPAADATLSYSLSKNSGPGFSWPKITYATATGGWVGSVNELMKFLVAVQNSTLLGAATGALMLDEQMGWFQPWGGGPSFYTAKNGGLYTAGSDPQGLNTAIVHSNDGYDAVILINTAGPNSGLWQPATLLTAYSAITGRALSEDDLSALYYPQDPVGI